MSKKAIFTEIDILEIKKLYEEEGVSIEDLARQFNTHTQRMSQLCKEQGFSKASRRIANLSEEQQLKLVRLYKKCKNVQEVAKNFDISEKMTLKYLRNFKLAPKQNKKSTPRKKIFNETEMQEVGRLYTEGKTLKQITKLYHADPEVIRKICVDLGIEIRSKKIKISQELQNKIKKLFDKNWGRRKIAKELGITTAIVLNAYKLMGISNKGRRRLWTPDNIPKERQCRGPCGEIKPIEEFRKGERKRGRIEYSYVCFNCEAELRREKLESIPIEERRKIREKYDEKYNNKSETKEKQRQKSKERKLQDPDYALRCRMGQVLMRILKTREFVDGNLIEKYFGYTIAEFRVHIEKYFKLPGNEWMSWEKLGKYLKKEYKEDDSTTWKINIDHIVPQSFFSRTHIGSEGFKFCWSPHNLRPYDAKKNVIEGMTKVRHKAFIWLIYCLIAQCFLVNGRKF